MPKSLGSFTITFLDEILNLPEFVNFEKNFNVHNLGLLEFYNFLKLGSQMAN